MFVFLNGEFVAPDQAVVPISDRSFLFGDGLFETVPFFNGKPFRWEAHMARLDEGLRFLRIELPFSAKELRAASLRLLGMNSMSNAIVRLTVSRGSGPRGYSIREARRPVVAMTTYPLEPDQKAEWKLVTSSVRVLAGDRLMALKTASRLRNVLARAEAEEQGADEGLLLNERGEITEGAATNVFCIQDGTVCTPPLVSGLLPGVTRAAVLEVCGSLNLATAERPLTPEDLGQAEGAFLTVSTLGIVEATALNGKTLARSAVVPRIRAAYWDLVRRETA